VGWFVETSFEDKKIKKSQKLDPDPGFISEQTPQSRNANYVFFLNLPEKLASSGEASARVETKMQFSILTKMQNFVYSWQISRNFGCSPAITKTFEIRSFLYVLLIRGSFNLPESASGF
jgi:hypothetical protein